MTQNKITQLQGTIVWLQAMHNACVEVLGGTPETTVCKKYGLDLGQFRRLVGLEKKGYTPRMKASELSSEAGARKLLKEILGQGYSDDIEIPDDFINNLYYLFNTKPALMKDERGWDIIYSHFLNNKSYREIGRVLNLSGTQVSQIAHKLIRKMSKPDIYKPLIYGLAYERAQKEFIKSVDPADLIENTDLSVRSKACLKRHGILTVQQLREYCDTAPNLEELIKKLTKIRNLGMASANEIVNKYYGGIVQ